MIRQLMTETVGTQYHTANIEEDEYSYVKAAGSKEALSQRLGHPVGEHFKLDRRFYDKDTNTVVLIETKQNFVKADEKQLQEYLEEERALNHGAKIICMLANTNDDKIKVWRSIIDDKHLLQDETVLDSMEHYINLFKANLSNDRTMVLANTYSLNALLHKMGIPEKLRSQFVGTILLHVKKLVKDWGLRYLSGDYAQAKMKNHVDELGPAALRTEVGETLQELLDGSHNKENKINLLKTKVLNNQHVRGLSKEEWETIFVTIMTDIYQYIDEDSSEGQDILNLFFIAFNKYTGKADKNQAFTPDHITEFMCRLTEVDWTKRVLDATCGSGSFLVQALVKELADARKGKREEQARACMETVKREHIYGIECEETAYGLATTNMLIHADGNSNIILESCFGSSQKGKMSPEKMRDWIINTASPDIILMNPPYNATPKTIPDAYKVNWNAKAKDGKADVTKGLVFVHYLSDLLKARNAELEQEGKKRKHIKMAVLLPLACAIGTGEIITAEKAALLEENTLEAVFSLPAEMFYPGASVNACCMLFTLGQPHVRPDGTARSTFFGYCKDDGFVKRKNLGRVEQFHADGTSIWKEHEEEWLELFRDKRAVDGKSAVRAVTAEDEWLCEAYMKTDYRQLTQDDFQQTINNYLAYLVKEGKVYQDGENVEGH